MPAGHPGEEGGASWDRGGGNDGGMMVMVLKIVLVVRTVMVVKTVMVPKKVMVHW